MSGNIYLLDGGDGSFKIGVTRGSVDNRVKKLQTGNPNEIIPIKYYHANNYLFLIEKRLHMLFSDKQLLNEWYKLSDEDVDEFIPLCEKIENQFASLKDNPFFKYNE